MAPLPSEIIRGTVASSGQPLRSNSIVARLLRNEGVAAGSEFRRIMDIPCVEWRDAIDGEFIARLTDYLRAPGGTLSLFPVQAAGLLALHDYGGLFGVITTGGGKTLLTYLAAHMRNAQRPVLLAPAGLVDKTLDDYRSYLQHFRPPPTVRIVTYEALGRVEYDGVLDELDPDLLMLDEFQGVAKVQSAGCAKRVRDFIARRIKDGRRVPVLAVTATPMDQSLRDFHHILMWALPFYCPLPMTWNEFEEWANAVDEDVDEFSRTAPGALLHMADSFGISANLDSLTRARLAVRRRLETCPGVVMTDDVPTGVRLQIVLDCSHGPDEVTMGHLEHLRATWETPAEDLLTEAVDMWRHAHEVLCGFVYYLDPAPPEAWLDARREWHRFVRHVLSHNRRRLFTPRQVRNAVQRGEYPEARAVHDAWFEIEPTYDREKHKKARWHSTWMLDFAAAWAHQTSGIVWTQHTEFGKTFAKHAGVPYFGQQGRDAKKRYIEDEACRGRPCVASIKANHKGRNLQHGWFENLIVSFPPNAKLLEQLLGRTFRTGQRQPIVRARFLVTVPEQQQCFDRAVKTAEMQEQVLRQRQKLLYAERLVA